MRLNLVTSISSKCKKKSNEEVGDKYDLKLTPAKKATYPKTNSLTFPAVTTCDSFMKMHLIKSDSGNESALFTYFIIQRDTPFWLVFRTLKTFSTATLLPSKTESCGDYATFLHVLYLLG